MAFNSAGTVITILEKVHEPMANAESVPGVGLLVSPLHIIASAIQLAIGTTIALISAFFWMCTTWCSKEISEFFADRALESLVHAGCGFLGILYSTGNILTLGMIAKKI